MSGKTELDKLHISVNSSEVETATAALDRLSDAAERARKALEDLSETPHGGIKINVIGEIAAIEIAPTA